MGQLRAAVRACAMVEDSPSAVLAVVDAAMSSLGQTSLTTCLCAVFDPATRRLRVASAGHLPPLVVHRDGGGEYVELDPGPPLGVAGYPPPEVEVLLPDGAVLLLFTDGLVEGRAQPVESGLLALRNAVADLTGLTCPESGSCDVEALCDALLRTMGRDGCPDDDSALLAVDTGQVQAGRGSDVTGLHLHLAGHLSEVARARQLTSSVAADAGVDVDDATLLVTELASNALRQRGSGCRPVAATGRRRWSAGRARRRPRHLVAAGPGPRRRGRGGCGLLIVTVLARSWGTDQLSAGECVWFELGPVAAG